MNDYSSSIQSPAESWIHLQFSKNDDERRQISKPCAQGGIFFFDFCIAISLTSFLRRQDQDSFVNLESLADERIIQQSDIKNQRKTN